MPEAKKPEPKTLQEKLAVIQQTLEAPKNQFNKFGGYAYRSCEDILQAVKPYLQDCTLTLADEVVQIGERYYVKATAVFADGSDAFFSVSSYAREEETRKGMDGSQITGSSSSYARKYALNGLFCIDDAKDADATNKHEDVAPSVPPPPPQQTTMPMSPDTRTCSIHGVVMHKAISKKTNKPYFSHMVEGQICFGSGVISK